MSLPIVTVSEAVPVGPAPPAETSGRLPAPERVRILLVEDEEVIVQMVRTIPGAVVTADASGRAGLEHAANHAYDVAVVDLRLPDMSGAEVASILDRTHAGLPVLLITGCQDTDPLLIEARSRLGCEVLLKPFSGDELIERIARILERRAEPVALSGSLSN